MGTLLGLIFYVLVMSRLLLRSEGSVYSTPDTALKFSQCLIDRFSESPFFSFGDRNDMIELAGTMAETIQHTLPDSRMTKVLIIALVTAVADVIILENSTRNIPRKEVYSEALENCSISSTDYIDTEFINEALNIMKTLESSKVKDYSDPYYYSDGHFEPGPEEYFEPGISTSDEYFETDLHSSKEYFEADFHATDEIFDPRAVQPSPVVPPVNPPPANFNPIFGLPQSSFQFPAVPPVRQSNVNIYTPNQPESYINPPSRFDSSGIYQSGGNVGVASSAAQESSFPVLGTSSHFASPEFGGLSRPPLDNPPFGKIPFQDQSVSKTAVSLFQPTDSLKTPPENAKSFPITPAASLPQVKVQDSDSFSTSLERIIYNILSSASAFLNAFHFGIDQQHALNLARTVTEQSLSGHEDIINDAIKAVSDAISRMIFKSPVDYALAIAHSLASVLQYNGMFMDGIRIANEFLSNLPDTKQISQPVVSIDDRKDFLPLNVPFQREQKQPPFDFETPTIAPENINGEIFSNTLREYLKESPEMSNIFCTPVFSTSKFTTSFSIIKASLSEYGGRISSVAASMATGALAELSTEKMCSEYSQAISQTIAEILDENRLLNNANPEEIFKRMIFSLNQKPTIPKSQEPRNMNNNTRNSSSMEIDNAFAQTPPALHPSFSTIANKYEEEPKVMPQNFNETSTDYVSPTTDDLYTTLMSDLPEGMKKQEEYIEETREETFTDSPISAPTLPINKPVTESEDRSALDILTTAIFSDSDEEFTSSSSLIDAITSVTESTDYTLKSSDYSTGSYRVLVEFLYGEMESALSSQSGDNADPTECASKISSLEDGRFIEEEASNTDESSVETVETTSNENNPRNENTFQTEYSQRNRRKKKRMTTVFQADTTTETPSAELNSRSGKDDDASLPRAPTRAKSSRRQTESRSQVQTKDLPSDDTSRDFPLKDMSEETGEGTVLLDNPVRRNSHSRPGLSVPKMQDSAVGDSSLTRRVMSVRTEDDDRISSDKLLRRASHQRSGSTHKIQGKDVLPEKSFSSDSSMKRPPVDLQPSFQEPVASDSVPSVRINPRRTNSRSSNLNDPKRSSRQSARKVSQISTSAIEYIRSDSFDFYELCGKLNELAGIVNIPPLDYCGEIPLIDFLLHVLRSITH